MSQRFSPLRSILDLLSSVRLGILTLAVLFVYMTIGSAGMFWPERVIGPDGASGWRLGHVMVRQLPAFELSEYEWFHTWTFIGLCALLCVNLTVTTIRKIPFNLMKLGPWMIHSGVIVLSVGSVIYFATKVEGDTFVIRRQLAVTTPEGSRGTLPILPGKSIEVRGEDDDSFYRVAIDAIDLDWPILSGADAGETTRAVRVRVDPPAGEPFFRQILEGYPQYTEDLVLRPGHASGRPMQRVVNLAAFGGSKLVDDGLRITPEPFVQDRYAVKDSSAVMWRVVEAGEGDGAWNELPLDGLPRYNDYVSEAGSIENSEGADEAARRRLELPAGTIELPGGDSLAVSATGFLRYAVMSESLRESDDPDAPVDPVLYLGMIDDRGTLNRHELRAFDASRSTAASGLIGFAWAESAGSLKPLRAMPMGTPPLTFVAGPGAGVPSGHVLLLQRVEEDVIVDRVVSLGEGIELGGGFVMMPMRLLRSPVSDAKPQIVPEHRRDRDVDRARLYSMVQVTLRGARWASEDWSSKHWLTYHRYDFRDASEADEGLAVFSPTRVELPGGDAIELMFTRETRPLPVPVSLDDFELTTRVGGFTGVVSSIRDWTSHVRFGEESEAASISTNDPAAHSGLWFFQSYWDAPRPGSAGLNFTGLGVTNRHGVNTMLAGSCLTVLGLIYAFYVKPIIQRRRVQRALAAHAESDGGESASTPPAVGERTRVKEREAEEVAV